MVDLSKAISHTYVMLSFLQCKRNHYSNHSIAQNTTTYELPIKSPTARLKSATQISHKRGIFQCLAIICPCFGSFSSPFATNAVVTCEIKLFQNYFSLNRRPTEIILFQCEKTCLKLFQNYFSSLLQLKSISNMSNVAEISLK